MDLLEGLFLILMCYFLISELIAALRDVRVRIPHAVRRNEKAILKCFYDIEDDSLYSVKWYKGRREFYRYTPKENPPMKVFHFPGVKVKVSGWVFSNKQTICLFMFIWGLNYKEGLPKYIKRELTISSFSECLICSIAFRTSVELYLRKTVLFEIKWQFNQGCDLKCWEYGHQTINCP